jgi:iron only hydrogenase large subunit-like protein
MKFIEFDPLKCDECYRCLRNCPTKAIAFNDNHREIIDDRCIKCGICQLHCEKGALQIHLDIDKVKMSIQRGDMVIASVAPSYAGAFDSEQAKLIYNILIKLGFTIVEETAIGAELVSGEYERMIAQSQRDNIITSCCPSSNYLIEQYYPEAIPSMLGVISPMVAHGKNLKDRYGSESFVVFIGPCLAKKAEAEEFSEAIDAVITFRELEEWIEGECLDLSKLSVDENSMGASKRGKAYPLGGSLWKSDLKTRINPRYEYIHIDGIESCHEFLKAVSDRSISGYCAELNICQGSCLNGPDLPKNAANYYERISRLKASIDESNECLHDEIETTNEEVACMDLSRVFTSKLVDEEISENEVLAVLSQMGKDLCEDRLNCGACGYTTCYEKAEAVVLGYSSPDMCMDLLRKNAEDIRSTIFENSPNAICIFDEDFRLREVNPSFNRIFNPDQVGVRHWPIHAFIDHEIFTEFKRSRNNILTRKIELDLTDRIVIANLVKLDKDQLNIGIFTDVTAAEKHREELTRVKEKTVETCQAVIDRQMRVVQEIASLLGETAAETKAGLNQLRDIVLEDKEF